MTSNTELRNERYVDRGDAVNLARNLLDDPVQFAMITPKGILMLCNAVMKMDAALRSETADTARLDYLEKEVLEEPLLLHNLRTPGGAFRGLGIGLGCTDRTLRKAIDYLMGAMNPNRQGDDK